MGGATHSRTIVPVCLIDPTKKQQEQQNNIKIIELTNQYEKDQVLITNKSNKNKHKNSYK